MPFERYPEGTAWISSALSITGDNGVVSLYIPDATITINDAVSSISSTQYPFDTIIPAPTSSDPNPTIPNPFTYIIHPKQVIPSPPYSLSLLISIQRNSPGPISVATNEWYIPVLGVIENEVPNYYPVATDPNLIFLVLRDPPGKKYTLYSSV